jgi:hypothetical protein
MRGPRSAMQIRHLTRKQASPSTACRCCRVGPAQLSKDQAGMARRPAGMISTLVDRSQKSMCPGADGSNCSLRPVLASRRNTDSPQLHAARQHASAVALSREVLRHWASYRAQVSQHAPYTGRVLEPVRNGMFASPQESLALPDVVSSIMRSGLPQASCLIAPTSSDSVPRTHNIHNRNLSMTRCGRCLSTTIQCNNKIRDLSCAFALRGRPIQSMIYHILSMTRNAASFVALTAQHWASRAKRALSCEMCLLTSASAS